MITGKISDAEKYYSVHKDFKAAFDVLRSLTPESAKGLQTISGFTVNVTEPTKADLTANGEPKPLEAHKKYIDLHYIIEGEEGFLYGDVETLDVTVPYHEEGDYLLLSGECGKIYLRTGDFCITFPEDAHAPAMLYKDADTVRRAVVKIEV